MGVSVQGYTEKILKEGIQADEILYSPLVRAADTAKHISEITGIPARPEPRLTEQNFGKWESTARDGADFKKATESRGFIFGVPIAYNLHKPFIPIRKKGKLPCETVSVEYELEYGTATIEMHKDAIKPGQRVVIIDDLIATGGTNEAMVKLIEGLGGKVVKTVFLMELAGLNGRDRLEGYDVDAVITYPGK